MEWRVLAGAEPFLAAAKEVVAGFAFEPATRDGRPLSARIRVEIPFHEQIVRPAARVEVVNIVRPKPKSQPPVPKDVEDVRVRGVRKELGGTSMTKEEVRDMPGAFGDAFRAIDMMPGVTPIISGLPFFFIRARHPGTPGTSSTTSACRSSTTLQSGRASSTRRSSIAWTSTRAASPRNTVASPAAS